MKLFARQFRLALTAYTSEVCIRHRTSMSTYYFLQIQSFLMYVISNMYVSITITTAIPGIIPVKLIALVGLKS